MKKAIGMAAVLLFVGATTAFGQAAMSGNSHDFSSTNPADAATNTFGVDLTSTDYQDQICVVCHAPHNVEATYEAAYLWNRRGTTVTSYDMYSSNTIDGTQDPSPATESKMCLSCHDGTVALEDFNGTTGGTTVMPDSTKAGTVTGTNLDLQREHPISLTYDVTDTGLITVATAETNGVNLYTQGGGAARVECGSCHDPHLENITAEATDKYFLRVPNAQSALCTTCHDK